MMHAAPAMLMWRLGRIAIHPALHEAPAPLLACFSTYASQRQKPDSKCSKKPATSNLAVAALHRGVPCRVSDFVIEPEQAVRRFEQYQAQQCKGFQVPGLLSSTPLLPCYLPFWSFSVTLSARYKILRAANRSDSSQPEDLDWDGAAWETLHEKKHFSQGSAGLQVYASYTCTRDLGKGAEQAAAAAAAVAATEPLSSQLGRGHHATKAGPEGLPRHLTAHEAASLSASAPAFVWDKTRDGGSRGSPAAPEGAAADGGPASGAAEQLDAGVPMQEPTMPQGLAWHLALQEVTRQLRARAQMLAGAQVLASARAGSTEAGGVVREVHVELKVHDRTAMLVFVPSYTAHYEYGARNKQGTSGVIVPQMFDALISGTGGKGPGYLSATPHVSPLKAGAAAGAVTAFATVSVAALWASGVGLVSGGSGGVQLATWAAEAAATALVAYAAGSSWARGLPQAAKNKTAAAQAAADRKFYTLYDRLQQQQQQSFYQEDVVEGAVASGRDDYMLWLWSDADWRRWQGEEPWNWDPSAKRVEAESLWRRQLSRPMERLRHRQHQREAAERMQAEDDRQQQEGAGADARAEQAGQRQAHGQNHQYKQGWRQRTAGSQYGPSGAGKTTRDFLGYYKILGMDLTATENSGPPTTEAVKAAFKAQAMQLHPDRFTSSAEDERKQAHVRFQKLQMAYDVLRDPEKRRLYDRGQLIQ